MYKHLYDKFKNWYDNNATIYLYSDPHFSDHEMPDIRTNYISDEEQVKRINSKVGKNDVLIILGDVGNIEWVKKIRGYKVLVMGNHDSGYSNYIKCMNINVEDNRIFDKVKKQTTEVRNRGLFDEVYEGPLIISEKIILSHEPVDFPFMLNIHGHTHNAKYKVDANHLCVCAEHIDYTPVRLNDIIKSGILKKIDSIHRETIDRATERKKKKKT